MGLAILLVVGLGLLIADAAFTRRHPPRRHPARHRSDAPASVRVSVRTPVRAPVPGAAGPEATERALTARLLAGVLDGASYRDRMAEVASTVDGTGSGRDALRVLSLDMSSLELLGHLGPSLPELEPATLCAAVNLARYGAGVDDLVRLLGLSYPQAVRISAATPRAH